MLWLLLPCLSGGGRLVLPAPSRALFSFWFCRYHRSTSRLTCAPHTAAQNAPRRAAGNFLLRIRATAASPPLRGNQPPGSGAKHGLALLRSLPRALPPGGATSHYTSSAPVSGSSLPPCISMAGTACFASSIPVPALRRWAQRRLPPVLCLHCTYHCPSHLHT